jgi:hypothetical protein
METSMPPVLGKETTVAVAGSALPAPFLPIHTFETPALFATRLSLFARSPRARGQATFSDEKRAAKNEQRASH